METSFLLVLWLLFGMSVPLPLGIPPRPEDPALLRAVPRDALVIVQWFGVARADGDATNVAERFARHPEVRYLFAEVDRAAMAWCAAQEEKAKDAPISPMQAAGLLRAALVSPGILFVSAIDPAAGPASLRGGLIVRPTGGEGGQAAERLFTTLKAVQQRLAPGEDADRPIASATTRTFPLPPPLPQVVFGVRGEHLFLAVGEGTAEAIVHGLEAQDGVGADPAFVARHGQVKVDRPVLRVCADVRALSKLVPDEDAERTLARFGLDGARHVLLENGLDATGMRSRAFLTLDGPPHGMLQSLAGKPLTPDDLRPVPAEVSMAFAARLQPEAMLDALRILRKPSPAPFVFGMFDGEGETDKAAREPDPIDEAHADLVAALGEVVTAWNAPGQGGFVFTGATLAVPVRDAAAAERAHARILAHLRTEFPPRTAKPSTATDPDQEEEYYARKSSLEQTTFGRHTIHYLNPRSYEPFAVAWCLTEKYLVVGLNLPVVKAALDHLQGDAPHLGSAPAFAAHAAGSMLLVQDTRTDFALLHTLGTLAAGQMCRSFQEDGFDLTIDAFPSAVAFRPVLGLELLGLRQVEGGFLLERQGRLPSLLGVLPMLPWWFVAVF